MAAHHIESSDYTGMAKTPDEFLLESIQSPDAFIAPDCPTGPCGKGIMPASLAQSFSSEELTAVGAPALHAELSKVDPVAAGKIHPNDLKRLVRAVEVFRKTGEPISAKHTHFGTRTLEGDVFAFKREDLLDRIARRTKKMLEMGLVEEVRELMKRPWGKEGRRAVGYREVVDFLEKRVDAAERRR